MTFRPEAESNPDPFEKTVARLHERAKALDREVGENLLEGKNSNWQQFGEQKVDEANGVLADLETARGAQRISNPSVDGAIARLQGTVALTLKTLELNGIEKARRSGE